MLPGMFMPGWARVAFWTLGHFERAMDRLHRIKDRIRR